MTQEKFRIMHSELIEHYQFIEMHLEAICAYLSDKSFMQGLEDVEKSNISHIVREHPTLRIPYFYPPPE